MLKRLNLILLLPLAVWCALGSTAEPPAAITPEAVEQARQAAVAANAATLATELLADGEQVLSKARRLDDKGKTEKAASQYQKAWQLFDQAELTAIKNDVLSRARSELTEARKLRAKKYAPRSLARAEQRAAEALKTLENDRNAIENARSLAENAAATARLAQRISTLAKEKPAVEDLLLDHASTLWRLQSAADLSQQADQNMEAATADLVEEISRLRNAEQQLGEDLEASRNYAAALEEEIRVLDQQLGGATAERRELVMRLELEARKAEQLEQAKQLFTADEAKVFQQSGVIVARLVGLRFASGSADIEPDADALFTKIRRLLAIYPGARINVEGHTDSRGGDRLNQKLSQNRAQSVMNRVIREAAIAPDRISAAGFGETRPIANNETAAGRAQNRRIDLLITPAVN